MKHKRWMLFVVLLLAALALSGCGVPRQGVDVTQVAPSNVWQTFVVWPMAKSLLWIDSTLQNIGLHEHWGFSIILFTLFVRLLTLPLTFTQIRGMQAQKDLQPKIQELQKKYGKDREKMAQEQMKLYREAGVNPLSGCLPLVVQMPILFGLYSALIALSPSIANSSFFWIPDLGFPHYSQGMSWIAEDFNSGNWGHLAAYLTLPALLMVSQYSMQKWMSPTPAPTGDGNDQSGMMRQVGTMMTLMFGFFTLQVPAGLSLYWVTSNLLQVLQQWMITGEKWKSFGLPWRTAAPSDQADAGATESDVRSEVAGSNGSEPSAVSTSQNGSAPKQKSRKSRRRRAKRK